MILKVKISFIYFERIKNLSNIIRHNKLYAQLYKPCINIKKNISFEKKNFFQYYHMIY